VRIVRHGERGHERFGLVDGSDNIRDAAALMTDVDPDDLTAVLERLGAAEPNDLPLVARGARLGCPVAHVGKIICIGLNYADHAAESGMKVPEEPVIFMKATSAICGPNDDVVLPRGSEKSDWEVELGVIIGTRANDISESEAMALMPISALSTYLRPALAGGRGEPRGSPGSAWAQDLADDDALQRGRDRKPLECRQLSDEVPRISRAHGASCSE
jgi:hypothetical protein